MEPMALGHLAVWKHPANGLPKARVLHIHGICEHSARHTNTFEALNSHGYEVVRFDLRGSGRSGGRRQWIENFSDYVADVASVFNWISSDLEPLPLFVMGHSMGGAIAIHFASEYGALIDGLILSAPGYFPGRNVSPWLIRVGRVMSYVAPTFRIHASQPSWLSRDPAVAQAYANDPLSYRFNTLAQGKAVLAGFAELPERCQRIKNPTLIYHGTADAVVLPEGSFHLIRALGSRDRELHYLPHGYHEPHLDIEKEKCFTLICRWLDQHLKVDAVSEVEAG